MQAVFGNDSFDAAGADHLAALTQLLGDHLGGSVAIEEPVPNDLPDDLIGPPVVRLGPPLLAPQPECPVLFERGAELEVPLLAVAELAGRGQGTGAFTLTLDEHEELVCDLVVVAHAQDAGRSHPRTVFGFELCHPGILRKKQSLARPRRREPTAIRITEMARKVK